MKQFMKAVRVTDKVYWVGAIDWNLRDFHGYATKQGSTYNAFLILADKVTLIDTVKAGFKDEMLARIASVIEPSKIDYIVSNHAEMDHSGCLPEMIKELKPEKVFASPMGVKALEAHFHIGGITAVKTGDELSLGNMTLSFIETKMLHWPDSMFSYLKEEQILFSQDAFGMHLATACLFVDENCQATMEHEFKTYFANILTPYSSQILKLLETFGQMNIPVKIVAPDHGPLRRGKDIAYALEQYRILSEQKPEPRAVVVYDTMWKSTESMANSIADGIRQAGGIKVEVIELSDSFRSDVATELLCAGIFAVGSPTLNNNLFPRTADILTYLKGLRFKNVIGAGFGSYGWSGESLGQINDGLKAMGVELVSEGIKVKYVPTAEDLAKCFELGEQLAATLKNKLTQ